MTVALTLLQLAASLLLVAQGNNSLSAEVKNQIVNISSQAVQLAAQNIAGDSAKPQILNESIWPNFAQLQRSFYLDAEGNRVLLGDKVAIAGEYTSFGDLNNDAVDDAAVVVRRTPEKGQPFYSLAFMLNQGGYLFNIADLDLGSKVEIYSHHVEFEQFTIDMKIGNRKRMVYHYKLIGTKPVRV